MIIDNIHKALTSEYLNPLKQEVIFNQTLNISRNT